MKRGGQLVNVFMICFFFSSRRRHTRYWRDWSSDVCSSDLKSAQREGEHEQKGTGRADEAPERQVRGQQIPEGRKRAQADVADVIAEAPARRFQDRKSVV